MRAARVEVVTTKNVQRGLAQKVQEISGQFRKKQRVYMQSKSFNPRIVGMHLIPEELQGHAIKNKDLLVASGAITLRGVDGLDELQEDEQAVSAKNQSGLTLQSKSQLQSQSQEIPNIDLNLEQRTNEIAQIASSISELAELFRDLGSMVVEQGTVLDSVEYNVQVTATELKDAVKELKVAQQ